MSRRFLFYASHNRNTTKIWLYLFLPTVPEHCPPPLENPFAWIGRLQSGIMKYHVIFKAWGFHPMDKAAADIRHWWCSSIHACD
jgi:hypothetical protein